MRWRITLILVISLLGFGGSARAQTTTSGAEFTVSVPQATIIQGEPWTLKFSIQWAQAVMLPEQPNGGDPDIHTEVEYPNGSRQSWANGPSPLPLPKRVPFETALDCAYSGESPVPICTPGQYRIRMHYAVNPSWPSRASFWPGEAVSNWTTVTILSPTGADAEVWEAFRALAPKGDCQQFTNWVMGGPATILSSFPTSTYAGYALMKMGPGGYLAGSADWAEKTPMQRAVAWAVPLGASPEKQEAQWQHVREGLESFVQQAQTFLALHPDFARADILRKELANALFQLDQRDAALQEVQKLAKMSGPVADEARAVLSQAKQSTPSP